VCKGLPPERAAKLLADALAKASDSPAQEALAQVLVEVCKGLPPERAATHLKPAAKLLVDALAKASNSPARATLAGVLVEVCQGLPPKVAATHLEPAAKLLADALAKASDSPARASLAWGLAEVCKGLPPERAATHLKPAAKLLVDALAKASDSPAQEALARSLAEVCQGLPADRAATHLLRGCVLYPELQQQFILSTLPHSAVSTVGLLSSPSGPGPLLAIFARVSEGAIPSLAEVVARSSLPDVVRVLQHPLCYGPARDLFLRRAEQLTGQKFATRWDLVDWLARNHPEIDLSAPPPEPE
jgi:ABC-type phosphate/phosphonate transport system substrate-binding protein